MSEFRRRIMMAMRRAIDLIYDAWFRKDGWFRSEPW